MESFDIKGSVRKSTGKKSTREIRKAGLVPCNLYGSKKDENGKIIATPFSVTNESLRNLIYTPHVYIVNLDIDGQVCKAVMREIQFHPVKDNVLHIDFYQIEENRPIVMEIPVQLEGLAEGVRAGGKLQLQTRKLKVMAVYDKIPDRLVINVSSLGLGGAIKVGDLAFEGMEILNTKETVVCTVKVTRAAITGTAETVAKTE